MTTDGEGRELLSRAIAAEWLAWDMWRKLTEDMDESEYLEYVKQFRAELKTDDEKGSFDKMIAVLFVRF